MRHPLIKLAAAAFVAGVALAATPAGAAPLPALNGLSDHASPVETVGHRYRYRGRGWGYRGYRGWGGWYGYRPYYRPYYGYYGYRPYYRPYYRPWYYNPYRYWW